MEEPLIFEIGSPETTGVDLPRPTADAASAASSAGGRSACRACPSRKPCATTCACRSKNYAIDSGLYPLGSCTMKHNPRLNEKMARLPGFADIHPLQPLHRAGRAGADRRTGDWLMV
jgi:glycine dehydrogenase subunit 2